MLLVPGHPDGKTTRAYPNGDVESSQGGHTQTWDASTGVHMDRTSAATTTYEANGMVTEVREGHTTVTLPSGIVIRDGRCDAIYDVIDGQRSYPGVRYATDDVGYSPPNPPVVVKQRVWEPTSQSYKRVNTYANTAHFENVMNVSLAKQEAGLAGPGGEQVIAAHD